MSEYNEPKIYVCQACLCRSCWDAVFFCQEYKQADLVLKTEAELRALDREHPDYFMPAFAEPSQVVI
jgi:hypothetical protein